MFKNLTSIEIEVIYDALRAHKATSADLGQPQSDYASEYARALRDLYEAAADAQSR